MTEAIINFGLDYDGTFDADPTLWMTWLKQAQARGHKVYVVTMRYPEEVRLHIPLPEELLFYANGVIFTSRQPKHEFCLKQGILINVWIDDNPRAVHESARQIWGTETPKGVVHSPTTERGNK